MVQFSLTREEALTLSDDQITEKRTKFETEQKRQRKEALELVVSYAKDIVEAWPKMTLRTLGQMTNRIKALKEALDMAK
jgi:hypothetical protein